ncbi:hypothetical protein BB31_06745 [Amycolatopsis lurida NRRL 2430]|uniref:Uncharacterized protein n=1 Tax=Amycolatopsis lurida NRRL 2430 TaxID=1460371 RepID=A0A2P2FZA6_AMYLU|nr:hypothetical protein BB31_06745 [Amycolatopsis lurida NRRL 2430]
MVRETGAWTWLEAFRRCSYLPARVLDEVAAADIVVLDPATITDTATYLDPTRAHRRVPGQAAAGRTAVTCQDAADLADRAGRQVRNTIPSGRTSRFGRGRTYLRECGHRCRANRIRV